MVVSNPGGDAPASPPDPILVCILNLFLGGVGYLLLTQKAKGIIAIVLCVLFVFPPSCGTLSGLVAAIAAVDGYLQAELVRLGKRIGPWTFFTRSA